MHAYSCDNIILWLFKSKFQDNDSLINEISG